MNLKTRNPIRDLVSAAMCLALCMVLPFLTGQIPQIGSMLCPMHIPVLLAGFVCGHWYALAVGGIAPIMRYALFGMPPLMPTGLAMTFELAAYGLIAGLLYRKLPKTVPNIYISLICALLAGRIVWGIATLLIMGVTGGSFGWTAFLTGAVTGAIPGIIVQLVLIPVLVYALRKAGVIE